MKKALRSSYYVLLVVVPPLTIILLFGGGPLLGGRVAELVAAGPTGGEVHGSVYAQIRGQETFVKNKTFVDPYIFLPDISVYLEDVKTSATSPVVVTDLDGTFIVPAQPQAEYRLCWKGTGYSPGCSAKTFVLRTRMPIWSPWQSALDLGSSSDAQH
jgi:hypothetical protein